ncbi:MAG: formylglycine-generating enzyme family protein [Methylococcaceae bacterium]|nr:formylglycine-generating enzyme family protein [Methylococcaceae bacterium]
MLRLTRRYYDNQGENALGHYARRHLQRLGAASKRHYRDYASALYGLAYQDDIRQGAAIPLDYDAVIVQTVSGQAVTPQTYYLLQKGEQLLITPQPSSFNGLQTGVVLAEFIAARDSVSVAIQGEDCTRQLPLLSTEPAPCIPLTGAAISLYTGLEQLQLLPIPKPSWAYAITQSSAGLNAYLAFAGQHYAFTWQAATSPLSAVDTPNDCHWRLNETTDRVGFDRYGLYAELSLGKVTQRFRWLAPGTFWMGSPDDEPQREWYGHEEGKGTETRHQVTLSLGYWMADTTVTQAFWQAVMGDNPSNFKDHPENPVEQVSWQDAQAFIEKLNSLFPGLQARLPSDAQWEYACRAGTNTPFSFGANITPEQVNYHGEYPYANGGKGVYRKQTVPVKSLPANDWGLYEMHGNVWEWCADAWQQNLSAEPVTDPLYTAAAAVTARVVRGGSWSYFGRDVRSAFRSRFTPDLRLYHLGFRLALGHAGLRPGQGVATGAGTGRRVAEQRQTVPVHVAIIAAASNMAKRIKKSSSKSKKKK